MVCLIGAYFLTYKGKYGPDEIYREMNSSAHWRRMIPVWRAVPVCVTAVWATSSCLCVEILCPACNTSFPALNLGPFGFIHWASEILASKSSLLLPTIPSASLLTRRLYILNAHFRGLKADKIFAMLNGVA